VAWRWTRSSLPRSPDGTRVIPSGTPLGEGQLVVTYNGQAGPPDQIRVVPRKFGIYSGEFVPPGYEAPSFYVPRRCRISTRRRNICQFVVNPARPRPTPGVVGHRTRGGRGRRVRWSGLGGYAHTRYGGVRRKYVREGSLRRRSGCCAGMDEIIVEIPQGSKAAMCRCGSGWGMTRMPAMKRGCPSHQVRRLLRSARAGRAGGTGAGRGQVDCGSS